MPCVVGKSILVSRTALEVAGGFPALQHYLAEDYLIGREVRRAGYRVVLSADVIDTMEVHKTARAVWNRHRRWAMMRRRLGGALYFAEAFAGALPWALAASSAGAWWPAAFLLAARYAFEGRVARALGSPALGPRHACSSRCATSERRPSSSPAWRGARSAGGEGRSRSAAIREISGAAARPSSSQADTRESAGRDG